MENRRPTINDVAELAGVSSATVSLVLNGHHKKGRISASTAENVTQVARRMGYLPDIGARRMRHRGKAPQSLVLSIISSRRVQLTLIGPLIHGVDTFYSGYRKPGISLSITLETFPGGYLSEHPAFAGECHFHGAILTSTNVEDDAFLGEMHFPAPIMLFRRRVPGYGHVAADDYANGRAAAGLFAEMGRRRPALLRPRELTQATRARGDGFREALAENGNPVLEEIIARSLWRQRAREAITQYLQEGGRADAIFAMDDGLAVGALEALKSGGRRVPDDVAVIGYDNAEISHVVDPPLTTFCEPCVKMAEDAARAIVDQLLGGAPVIQRTYPSRLILRASTGHCEEEREIQPMSEGARARPT